LLRITTLLFICLTNFAFANEVEIWTSNENIKIALEKLVPQFERDFKAKVQVTVLNKDLTSQFKTAAMSGKGPDILCWAHDVVGELASSGLIEPIILDPEISSQIIPVALKAYTFQNKLYGYPYDLESVALIYNKDLLAYVPNSLEELISKHSEYKAKEKNVFLYDFTNFFFSFPILSAAGGYIFKDTGAGLNVKDIGLSNKGAITGATFIRDLAAKGIIPSSTERSIAFDKMIKGLLAATIDGPWAINDLKKAKINYGVAPIPSLAGHTPRPFVGTHGFMIRRSSKNKELAKELVEGYFMTKKGIRSIYEADPRGPSRKDVIAEIGNTNADLKAFMLSAQNGLPMPNVPQMGSVWGAAGSALKLIVNQQSSPEEAMTKAVKQIQASTK
jgi:maltose/maltodextrin transport system substrate-binding protein